MAMASELKGLNHQPRISEGWTRRSLMTVSAVMSSAVKGVNAFEFLMIGMVLMTGLGEIQSIEFSRAWYAALFFFAFAATAIKILNTLPLKATTEKK